jgi:hypothetical protein
MGCRDNQFSYEYFASIYTYINIHTYIIKAGIYSIYMKPGSRHQWEANYVESTDAYEDYAEILYI